VTLSEMLKLKILKVVLTWASLYLMADLVSAQALTFETKFNDSSLGEIRRIFQDSQGYIWLAGQHSVVRYNAYEYKVISYKESSGDSTELYDPHRAKNFFEDSRGDIWLSSDSGVFIFDHDNEFFIRPNPRNGKFAGLLRSPFMTIKELPNGDLIGGGFDSAIVVINHSTHNIHQIIDPPMEAKDGKNETVNNIIIDDNQKIWVATKRGLVSVNLNTQKKKLYIPNPSESSSEIENNLISMADDNRGNILLGTIRAGLYVFNKESKKFTNYRNDKKNDTSLPSNAIWSILVDSNNVIWLAHDHVGFSHFDSIAGTFKMYNYRFGEPGSLLYNTARDVFEDSNRDIWVGHYPQGVSFHDQSTRAIVVHLPDSESSSAIAAKEISAIMEDEKENIWVVTSGGPDYFQPTLGTFKHYNQHRQNYTPSGALSGYLDHKGDVWVGTWTEGYHRYNRKDEIFTKFTEDRNIGNLANKIAWTCFEDSKGRLWVGTASGLSRLNRDKKTFVNYYANPEDTHSLGSNSIVDIYEDQLNRLWFATGTGLNMYLEESNNFLIYGKKDGFHNQGVRAITAEDNGVLWLGTNDGISRFDPITLEVKNFVSHGGRKFGSINIGAALTSSKGKLIFGSNAGLIIIDAKRLSTNKTPPSVVFDDFKIFSKSVTPGQEKSTLSKVVNRSESITLDHTKKMFSFDFSALSYRHSNDNQYAYFLEGFDSEWNQIGNERQAQYTNLSQGVYTFKVKASNSDGVWSKQEKSIVIYQLPPPWKTWWAYTTYALLIFGALFLLLYTQRRKQTLVEEQNRLLEIKVADRTADLATKNRDINSMLSNMKAGLFTIQASGKIHHEYSKYLEIIYSTTKIHGANVIDFLFANSKLNEDEVDQVQSTIASPRFCPWTGTQ